MNILESDRRDLKLFQYQWHHCVMGRPYRTCNKAISDSVRKCGVVHSWAGWTYSCLKAMAAHSSPIGVLHGGGISLNISTNSWSIFDPISGINSGVPNLRKSIAHCSPGGRIKSGNLRYIALRELATGGIGWDGPRMHQAGPNMAVKWLTLRYPYYANRSLL